MSDLSPTDCPYADSFNPTYGHTRSFTDSRAVNVPELEGTFIGPYKLVRKLGEGGMGAVWAAEQEQPVRRSVAVKLIKPGLTGERGIVARFEAERQALALMDHAGIARVFDAGASATGQPYFVMELVRGSPITLYCDEYRLTIRERLGLFARVCQAIQHAHQKGVIHRDLKPSNILVTLHDGVPVPKVIDFGVAKALHARPTDQTVYTEVGAVVGTPEYMSPEQAELSSLDVDTRSDVYSLGVILYELLTGATPLGRARAKCIPLAKQLQIVREEEPVRPSSRLTSFKTTLPELAARRRTEPRRLSGEVRGELDWIVMRTLEKDRARRYDSASSLARDIQHYLANEPIEAGPPSGWYRARKFLRRHRGPVLAAVLLLLTLSAGVVGTTVGLVRATTAEHVAREQARLAGAERDKARAALKQEIVANGEATETLDIATSYELEHFFTRRGAVGERETKYLRAILSLYEKVAARGGDSEEAHAMAARGQLRVARIFGLLRKDTEAEAAYRKALPRYRKLAADYPEVPLYRREWGICHLFLGELLALREQFPQAEVEFRAARDIHEPLTCEYPAVPIYWRDLWGDTLQLGNALLRQDQPAAAEPLIRDAVAIADRLVRQRPAEPNYRNLSDEIPFAPQYRFYLGNSHEMLAAAYTQLRRPTDAIQNYRAAQTVYESIIREYPAEWEYLWNAASSHGEAGRLLAEAKRDREAEAALRRAVELNERLVTVLPAVAVYRYSLARRYQALGGFLRDRGDLPAAARWWKKAVPLAQALHAANKLKGQPGQLLTELRADLARVVPEPAPEPHAAR
jgi:serine/threonine protein kinase